MSTWQALRLERVGKTYTKKRSCTHLLFFCDDTISHTKAASNWIVGRTLWYRVHSDVDSTGHHRESKVHGTRTRTNPESAVTYVLLTDLASSYESVSSESTSLSYDLTPLDVKHLVQDVLEHHLHSPPSHITLHHRSRQGPTGYHDDSIWIRETLIRPQRGLGGRKAREYGLLDCTG